MEGPCEGIRCVKLGAPLLQGLEREGGFRNPWAAGLLRYGEAQGIGWEWLSADGCMTKAPPALQSVGNNPSDRGKKGSKRHLPVDERGVPLSIVVTWANRHDVTRLGRLPDLAEVERPYIFDTPRHLCLDKGYAGEPALEAVVIGGFIPHVRGRNGENPGSEENPGGKARRWVVEAAHSWMNRFRKLLVRFEKLNESCLDLLMFACSFIAFRKAGVI